MTLPEINTLDKTYVFDEHDLPGEIYDPIDESEINEFLSPSQVMVELVRGDLEPDMNFWSKAREKYAYLADDKYEDARMVWELINDMSYLADLTAALENKPDDEHWVDIYRRNYKHLDQIVQKYTQTDYVNLDKIFSVSMIAQELSNDLFLEQTRPATEARSFPEVDEYTGIETDAEPEEYITIPDVIELKNADGELERIVVSDWDSQSRWSGDLSDPDHEWYEEGEIASEPIKQMNEQEYKVTDEYYHLRVKYAPMVEELRRRVLDDVLVKFANPENKSFAIESAIHKISQSSLFKAFQKSLRMEYQSGIPIQDIAAYVMSTPYPTYINGETVWTPFYLPIEINGNVSTVIELFGDDILESIMEPFGIDDYDESAWEDQLETLHKETLSMLEMVSNQYSPKHHPLFTVEVFKAIAEDQLPVQQATSKAYDKFRAISPTGSNAYRQAINANKTPSQAMREFYKKAQEAGEYTPRDKFHSATSKTVTIQTASSGYTEQRKISWNLAKYKARQGELYVPNDAPEKSKRWLYKTLKAKNWGKSLIAKLAE